MNATEVIVSWKDVTDTETGFKVEQRIGSGAWTQVGTLLPPNTTTKRVSGLITNSGYAYRVSTLRAGETTVASDAVSVTLPSATVQSVFYVAPGGSNSNPGTEDRPWQTIQKAADSLLPGQTVLVRQGTYKRSNYYTIVQIYKSGTANAWITYKNYPGETPTLQTTKGKNYNCFEIKATSSTPAGTAPSYIAIDGFEMAGHANEVTKAEADLSFRRFKDYYFDAAGKPQLPANRPVDAIKFEAADVASSGFSVDGRDSSRPAPRHIIIRNNDIHDHPLGGGSGLGVDYMTIEYNRISNVGRYSAYGGSGISFLGPRNYDNNTTDYKLIIRGNIVSDAINDYACDCFDFKAPTDGNGIILDTMDNGDFKGAMDAVVGGYKGRSLVTNNIVFNNGARGIHVFGSSNVDVFYNTTSRNSTKQVTGEGEITVVRSRNVRVYNNVFVARNDRPAYTISFKDAADKTANGNSVDVNHNLFFGGLPPPAITSKTGALGVSNQLGVDPQFAIQTGPTAYSLNPTSPAVNAASSIFGITPPTTDVYLAPRPRGGTRDRGAVESY